MLLLSWQEIFHDARIFQASQLGNLYQLLQVGPTGRGLKKLRLVVQINLIQSQWRLTKA